MDFIQIIKYTNFDYNNILYKKYQKTIIIS